MAPSLQRCLAGLASNRPERRNPFIIENKPGAGGTLGPGSMGLTAKPDGYTIAQYPLSMLRTPLLNKVDWDPIENFNFVIGMTGYTFGFTVRADSPYKTFDDFIAAARENPGKINYGHTGRGTAPHLFMERIAMNAKVPTMQELGYGVVSSSPYGIAGPNGMDPAVVQILHDAFKKALDDPRHLALLEQLNQEVWYRNSTDYEAFVRETQVEETELLTKLGLRTQF